MTTLWGQLFGLAAVALAACSPSPSDVPTAEGIEAAASRLDETTIKLRDGSCINSALAPAPWIAVPGEGVDTLMIAAPGNAIGVEPFDNGNERDFHGRPNDGSVRISVGRYGPDNLVLVNPVGELAGVDSGRSTLLELWNEGSSMVAVKRNPDGFRYYFDRAGRIQCRDHAPIGDLLWCIVVSEDQQVSFGVELSRREVATLPDTLTSFTQVVDSLRSECPFAAKVQGSNS